MDLIETEPDINDPNHDIWQVEEDERQHRARILEPVIEALTEMRDEYAKSQPCRSPVDVVELALDLVREGLIVPDDFDE